jgi:hypothetical protein
LWQPLLQPPPSDVDPPTTATVTAPVAAARDMTLAYALSDEGSTRWLRRQKS